MCTLVSCALTRFSFARFVTQSPLPANVSGLVLPVAGGEAESSVGVAVVVLLLKLLAACVILGVLARFVLRHLFYKFAARLAASPTRSGYAIIAVLLTPPLPLRL